MTDTIAAMPAASSAPVAPQPAAAPPSPASGTMSVSTLEPSEYLALERHVLQDNIILCDAKSGILLTFSGLIMLRCLDKLHDLTREPDVGSFAVVVSIICYLMAFAALAGTIYFAWKTIRPRFRPGVDYIFWSSPLFRKPEDEFVGVIQATTPASLAAGTIRYLHRLASICHEKYGQFHRAVVVAEFAAGFFLAAEAVWYLTH